LSLILLQLEKSTPASETPSKVATQARTAALLSSHNHRCNTTTPQKRVFLHLAGKANPLGDTQQKKKENKEEG
jgi:hypothetical protein